MMRKTVWVVIAIAVALLAGCGSHKQSAKPSDVVTDFLNSVAANKVDRAIQDLDPQTVNFTGEASFRTKLAYDANNMASKGGIDKVDILSTAEEGAGAVVKCKVTYKNGLADDAHQYQLVKTQDGWKIASIR